MEQVQLRITELNGRGVARPDGKITSVPRIDDLIRDIIPIPQVHPVQVLDEVIFRLFLAPRSGRRSSGLLLFQDSLTLGIAHREINLLLFFGRHLFTTSGALRFEGRAFVVVVIVGGAVGRRVHHTAFPDGYGRRWAAGGVKRRETYTTNIALIGRQVVR